MKRPLVIATLLVLLLLSALAFARPGGGHSFSGGSSHSSSSSYSGGSHSYSGGGSSYSGGGSSSGSSGDGGAMLYWFFRLLFMQPLIGVPVLLLIIFLIWRYSRATSRPLDWSTGAAKVARRIRLSQQIAALRDLDPDFSRAVFEDFLYSLYAAVHTARGAGALDTMSPYISAQARAELLANFTAQPITEVKSIVIGAMSIHELSNVAGPGPKVMARVSFESQNFTEQGADGRLVGVPPTRGGAPDRACGYYINETWTLARDKAARSRAPDKVRVFACPNCDAPLTQVDKGKCAYCGTQVDTGGFDWLVTRCELDARETKSPQLGNDAPEMGGDMPTVFDPDLDSRTLELVGRDPSYNVPQLRQRIALIFGELQTGWSTRDWTRVRPFVSDLLFQSQLYWIEEYKKQHLRNVTEKAHITGMDVVKVVNDRWFDSITVRLAASSLDYTISDDGKVISGSRSRERAYTEYWTLIRGTARAATHKPTVIEKKCPNCGAELKVNQAGTCEYCQARVSSGDFDWVLSRIEQDETYDG